MTELQLLNRWIDRLNRAATTFDAATVKQVAREIEAYKLGAGFREDKPVWGEDWK